VTIAPQRNIPIDTKPKAIPLRGSHDAAVPILMYHVIGSAPASFPYPDLFVSKAVFTGQMRWLAAHGYHAVTMRKVFDYWHGKSALPRRPVVLSFDDGYHSDTTVALPTLRAHGWAGVLNLEVHNLGPGGIRPYGIRMLLHAGWEIDAHTLSHPDLTTLDDARLKQEIAGSRAALRARFHVPVDFFCYPSGRFNDHVVAAVRAAGFEGATTTQYGLGRPGDPYRLDRVRVNGSDGVSGFAAKMQALA
jgi:peptidoglycan/xylan/chitin deacetylase (PgdA/CDA1 family)